MYSIVVKGTADSKIIFVLKKFIAELRHHKLVNWKISHNVQRERF